jgi:DNA-binding transcriptional ArsR family regulator
VVSGGESRDFSTPRRGDAHSTRRKLLDLLHAHDGQTLNELCEELDMTRQGVTQHQDQLETANLVATMRRGREKLHFPNLVPLQEIHERWIAKFEKPRLKPLADLKKRMEKANGWADLRLRELHSRHAGEVVDGADRSRVHQAILVRHGLREPVHDGAVNLSITHGIERDPSKFIDAVRR